MAVTIKDIARSAQISAVTVSRILGNKQGHYSAATAEKVRKIAQTMGYHKNIAAAELVTRKSHVVAVIIGATKTNFAEKIVEGIEKSAIQYGYHIVLLTVEPNNPQSQTRALQTILGRPIYGVLLLSLALTAKNFQLLQATELPYLFISIGISDKASFISSNDFQIGYQATSFLIAKGHTKIGIAGMTDDSYIGQQRVAGFKQALRESKLSIQDDWIQFGDFTYEAGIKAMREYGPNPELTAVIGTSDLVSIGLLNAASDFNLAVPQRLSILSIDGTQLTKIVRPQLSSITQDFYQMGYQGLQTLIQQANHKDKAHYLPFKIIERGSTSQLP
ncbi:MAG: LacI family DNA-binding transcriptional regulator [Liquorilactobacillus nagelii]|jgi:LacI family transcriptional regulator|uniref:LacI family DNA-binding transcriptional regulator n=3 Tax=Liquorilactobacillus nagelii TaxID=82688 RepID=UPI0039EAC0B6